MVHAQKKRAATAVVADPRGHLRDLLATPRGPGHVGRVALDADDLPVASEEGTPVHGAELAGPDALLHVHGHLGGRRDGGEALRGTRAAETHRFALIRAAP